MRALIQYSTVQYSSNIILKKTLQYGGGVSPPGQNRRRRRGVVDPVHRALRALRRLDARLRVVLEQRAEERAVPRDDVLHRAAPDAGVSRRLARDARDLDPSVRAEAAREPRVLLDV